MAFWYRMADRSWGLIGVDGQGAKRFLAAICYLKM
jgi:hypothetical protein